jgi:hypothetical protein
VKKIAIYVVALVIIAVLSVLYFTKENGEQKALRLAKNSHVLGTNLTTEIALQKILSNELGIKDIEGWKVIRDKKNKNRYFVTFSYETAQDGKIYQLFDVYPDLEIVRHMTPDELDTLKKYDNKNNKVE